MKTEEELAKGSQTLTSQGKINNQGKIKSTNGSVTLSTNADIENAGKLVAKKDIKLEGAQNILNSGSILASEVLDLSTLGKFTNTQDAKTSSVKDLTIVANDDLNNQGEILALDGITTIKSGKNIINREGGNITGALGAGLKADKSIINSSSIFSSGDIDISAAETIHNKDRGQIGSGQKLSISSATGSITNDGIIGAEGDVLLKSATSLVNNGHILSVKEIEVNGELLEIRGQINAVKFIKLLSKGDIANIDSGLIKSGGELTITSREGHVKNINSDPVREGSSGIIAVDNATIKLDSYTIRAKALPESEIMRSDNDKLKKAFEKEKLKGEIKQEISKIKMGLESQLPEENILQELSHTKENFFEIKEYFADHPSAIEEDDNESVLIGELGINMEDASDTI